MTIQQGACTLHAGLLRLQTHTHSEYLIHTAFPLHQQSRERVSMLRHTCIACLVYSNITIKNRFLEPFLAYDLNVYTPDRLHLTMLSPQTVNVPELLNIFIANDTSTRGDSNYYLEWPQFLGAEVHRNVNEAIRTYYETEGMLLPRDACMYCS